MIFDLLSKDDMFRRRPPSSGIGTIISALQIIYSLLYFYDAFGIPLRLHADGRQFYEIK
jgi:hypothetical protein